MTVLASDLSSLGVGDAALVAVLGYCVVFFGIAMLMLVVWIMGKVFVSMEQKAPAAVPAPAPAPEPAPAPLAPGAAGTLKLHNVEPKTAAMLMAIVADKMGKPLNELRFISIKEVE